MKFLGEIHAGHILTSTPWNNGASLVTQLLKNPTTWETPGSTPGLGRSPEEGRGYPPPVLGFPDSSAGKESAGNVGELGSIPGLGRSPAGGKGHPLQYSGLEDSMDCIVHGAADSQTRLSDFHLEE